MAVVNVTLTLDSVDLLHLPTLMHWHSAVGLGNVRFSHDEGDTTMIASESDESSPEVRDVV